MVVIRIIDYLADNQPEVLPVLEKMGFQYTPEKEDEDPMFGWWDKLMRQIPRGR